MMKKRFAIDIVNKMMENLVAKKSDILEGVGLSPEQWPRWQKRLRIKERRTKTIKT
jgi:hypothetical protein